MYNVRIGFSQPTSISFVSRAIMWFQGSRASHSFVQVAIDGREMVVGADDNGFVMQSLEKFLKTNRVLALYGPAELGYDLDQGKDYLLDVLDEDYDVTGLLGMAWVELGRWVFGQKWRNPWGSKTKLFCSEAVTEMLIAIGFPDAKVLEPDSTDPQTLWDFLEQRRQSELELAEVC